MEMDKLMEESTPHNNAKLEIAFPKSDQDQKLRLISINGSMFAIVHAPLESQGPINLNCKDWSLILLAPIKSKTNITISAINIICLSEIVSEEGDVNILASAQLVKFSPKQSEKSIETGGRGEFYFQDDAGALLYYYRLYSDILNQIHEGNTESFYKAQQQFISSLCTLADKIEGKPETLNLYKVLNVWDIPNLEI